MYLVLKAITLSYLTAFSTASVSFNLQGNSTYLSTILNINIGTILGTTKSIFPTGLFERSLLPPHCTCLKSLIAMDLRFGYRFIRVIFVLMQAPMS